jgi:predicted enzyme related to lactoylglutathione lyase
MKNRVIHFEIQADDIERAKNFYTKAFSWNISQIMTADDKGSIDYWGLTTGSDKVTGINGGMYKRPEDKKIYTFDCTIEVENLDETIEKIKMHGGRIDGEKMEIPKVGWFAKAIDTEGNMFGLMQSTGEKM